MDISVKETARQLERAQDVVIVAHKSPDGDTLGSSFALRYGRWESARGWSAPTPSRRSTSIF